MKIMNSAYTFYRSSPSIRGQDNNSSSFREALNGVEGKNGSIHHPILSPFGSYETRNLLTLAKSPKEDPIKKVMPASEVIGAYNNN